MIPEKSWQRRVIVTTDDNFAARVNEQQGPYVGERKVKAGAESCLAAPWRATWCVRVVSVLVGAHGWLPCSAYGWEM